jgi:hypothetical protein
MTRFYRIYNILKFLFVFVLTIILMISTQIFILMKLPGDRKNIWVPALTGIISASILVFFLLSNLLSKYM